MTTTQNTKDELLLRLGDGYVQGKPTEVAVLTDPTQEEREVIADLRSEGAIEELIPGAFRFTDKGYKTYRDRISALRQLRKL